MQVRRDSGFMAHKECQSMLMSSSLISSWFDHIHKADGKSPVTGAGLEAKKCLPCQISNYCSLIFTGCRRNHKHRPCHWPICRWSNYWVLVLTPKVCRKVCCCMQKLLSFSIYRHFCLKINQWQNLETSASNWTQTQSAGNSTTWASDIYQNLNWIKYL